jgi:RNA 3'-terminal phosphate cyclase (ATP)
MSVVEVDGSIGEGGGQILRTALALACITGKKVKVYNIRANRKPRGLSYQHLYVARAVRKICRGELRGDELRSEEISFTPGKIVAGRYRIKLYTAASTLLAAQTLLPIALHGSKPSSFEIEGGTHVKGSPCYEYFEEVFLRALRFMGIDAESRLIKPGYYPKGGGKIEVNVKPSSFHFPGLWPEEGKEKAIIRISGLPFSIALREKKVFVSEGIEDVRIIEEKGEKGNAVMVWKGFV